jgi:glucokinase
MCIRDSIDDLLAVADAARARGADVVAITAPRSPLARKADVALIVDHLEDTSTHVPMVSRILHLLVIDILAVGVAMRRGDDVAPAVVGLAPAAGSAAAEGARRGVPGVSTPVPLARLTSHSR